MALTAAVQGMLKWPSPHPSTALNILACYATSARAAKPATTAKKKKKGKAAAPDEADPRLQKAIEMLQFNKKDVWVPLPEEEKEAYIKSKEYAHRWQLQHGSWMQDVVVKFNLQKAALNSLPPPLRKAARQPDYTPLPLNRNFYFDSPPEAYRDK